MRINGRIVFNLALIAVAAAAIFMAREWSFKAAFFPLVTSIPLLAFATVQLLVDLFGRSSAAGESRHDLEFAVDVAPELARRRTIAIFAWIAGFILLAFLLGFPYAVPIFVFAYLAPQSGVGWRLKIALPAIAWGFFYGLFVRLLHLPFEAGWIQTLLGWG
jgi:hypothetical protein